jgi:electron transfer flavoprotein beta subunit
LPTGGREGAGVSELQCEGAGVSELQSEGASVSSGPVRPPVVVACMKRVELRAGVDPLTGDVLPDPASAGPSPADEAALEWALRIAEASGVGVVAVSVGGPECDPMLRGAIGAGAASALRVPLASDAAGAPSHVVARALARAVAGVAGEGAPPSARARAPAPASAPAPAHGRDDPTLNADGAGRPALVVVCCGDASVDRGSGSVPAFLAGELEVAQGLGLVGVSLTAWTVSEQDLPSLEVERRLDRGRRERLRLTPPFVMSVEAGTARLRRASLRRSLASLEAVVTVLPEEASESDTPVELVGHEAYRPRTRVVSPPAAGLGPRDRIAALTGALHERPAARTLVLDAEVAADELLAALAEWGELPDVATAADSELDDTEAS